jgi:hypothetical protein
MKGLNQPDGPAEEMLADAYELILSGWCRALPLRMNSVGPWNLRARAPGVGLRPAL